MPQYLVAGRFAEQCERGPQRYSPHRRGGAKSFVDDLVLGRGVVLSRAATTLRSIETQPWTRRFVCFQTDNIIPASLNKGRGVRAVSLIFFYFFFKVWVVKAAAQHFNPPKIVAM